MKRAGLLALVLLWPARAFAFGGLDDPQTMAEGASWGRFDLSYVHFSSYFDPYGSRTSLNSAYATVSGNGSGIYEDSTVVSFSGRYFFAHGLSAAFYVPLVRDSRSGQSLQVSGDSQSIYAEGSAIGDLLGDVTYEASIPDHAATVGGSLAIQAPTGQWGGRVDSDELATGAGTVGLGAELFTSLRGDRLQSQAATGVLVFTDRSDGAVLGNAFWLRGSLGGRILAGTNAGAELLLLTMGGGRQAGSPAQVNPAAPGALQPAGSLITLAPYLETRLGEQTHLRLSFSNPGPGWLFLPVQTGVALAGRNVLAPDLQLAASVQSRF